MKLPAKAKGFCIKLNTLDNSKEGQKAAAVLRPPSGCLSSPSSCSESPQHGAAVALEACISVGEGCHVNQLVTEGLHLSSHARKLISLRMRRRPLEVKWAK